MTPPPTRTWRLRLAASLLAALTALSITPSFAADYVLPERTLVNGLVFKKGSTLTVNNAGFPVRGTLEAVTLNNGLSWAADAELTLSDNAIPSLVVSGKLAPADQKISALGKTLTLKGGTTVVMQQPLLSTLGVFTVASDLPLDAGSVSANTAMAGTEVTLNDDQSVRAATLSAGFDAQGLRFAPGLSSFYPGGKPLNLGPLRMGTLDVDGLLGGVLLAKGTKVTFNETGTIAELQLARSTKFGEVLIPEKSVLIYAGRRISQVFLGADLAHKGKTYLASQYVPFNFVGEPYVPQIK